MLKAWGKLLEPVIRRFRGFPKLGEPFGGPFSKDYSILASILGSLSLGKLPCG